MAYSSLGIQGTATGVATWNAIKDGEIEIIKASVGVAPTGANFVLAVKQNGSTVATLTITAGTKTDYDTPGSPYAFDADDEFTVDVTQVGSTIPGSELLVQFWGTYTP